MPLVPPRIGEVVQAKWRDVFEAPSTATDQPRAVLRRLGGLITALDPQDLDPERCGVSAAEGGAVVATLVHRADGLADITIYCSDDGMASIDCTLLGAPAEIFQLKQSLEDWHADVLDVVTDALLQNYTRTDYWRSGRLLRTRVTSDSPERAGSIVVFGHWTGMLPMLRRKLDTTTQRIGYGCQGEPPPWLLRSAIFVINADGIVAVYPHQTYAEASLEEIDIAAGEYLLAYSGHGVAFRVEPYLDNGRLVPTGKVDPQGLSAALRSWRYGPHHLADDPHAYAVHVLAKR